VRDPELEAKLGDRKHKAQRGEPEPKAGDCRRNLVATNHNLESDNRVPGRNKLSGRKWVRLEDNPGSLGLKLIRNSRGPEEVGVSNPGHPELNHPDLDLGGLVGLDPKVASNKMKVRMTSLATRKGPMRAVHSRHD